MADFVRPDAIRFIRSHAAQHDAVLEAVQDAVRENGLPMISPEAGKTIHVLLRTAKAKEVVEAGTCLGYSGIWIARALPPDGRLETLEFDEHRADIAQGFFERAAVASRVTIVRGDAHASLRAMKAQSRDAVFVDAEKEGMADYLEQSLRILRPGGLLIADNVFWHGSTFEGAPAIPGSREMRAFVDAATSHPRLHATILPLGDGLLVARKE